MKEDKVQRIFKKYKEGKSTLHEEQYLFDNIQKSEPSLKSWSTFVKNNKTKIPKDINDRLWKSFEQKKNKKRQIYIAIMSTAASVAFVIALLFTQPKHQDLSYSKKEDVLNLALNILSNPPKSEMQKNIIYESDMMIIYTTNE